jgi:hypothetical protein
MSTNRDIAAAAEVTASTVNIKTINKERVYHDLHDIRFTDGVIFFALKKSMYYERISL